MQEKTITINLESLLSLSAQLNETNSEHNILSITLLSLMGKLRISKAAVFVPKNNRFVMQQYKGKKPVDSLPTIDVKDVCTTKNIKPFQDLDYDICTPIKYREELIAVIALGKKFDSTELTDEEYYYTSLVSTITANALNNARNIRLLVQEKNIVEQRNQLLTTLFEVSRDFNLFLTSEKILKTLSLNLQGQLLITRYAVIYFDEDSSGFSILKSNFKYKINLEWFHELNDVDDITFTKDLTLNSEFKNWIDKSNVKVVSPMTIQNKKKGYLLIGSKSIGQDFSEENLLFIKVVGNTSILALENLKFIEKEVERRQLENELSIALEIQNKLLPKEIPSIDGLDIFGYSIPSRFVGGDYFDYIETTKNELLFAIADVSGKGIPAALLMANVQAALRSLAPLNIPLNKMVNMLNMIVFNNTSADRFVTFFCGILNTKSLKLQYINAGHNPPIHISKSNYVSKLNKGGIILGVLDEEIAYEVGEIQLNSKDLILLYTDGITETTNSIDEEFGEHRLEKLLKTTKDKSSNSILETILNEIELFESKDSQTDDITMISLKVD